MNRLRLLAIAVPALLLAFFTTSCGQTYHLQSIVLSPPSTTIEGISNYATFKVVAQNSNGQTEDVTTRAVFSLSADSNVLTPAQLNYILANVTLRQGLANQVQVVGPVCTWSWQESVTTDGSGNKTYTHVYGTQPLNITATFNGMTSSGTISINSATGCYDPSNPEPDGQGSGSGVPAGS